MKFNQTRHLFLLILIINLAIARLTANDTITFVPDICSHLGTIVMPDTDWCGPYILLDDGLKIRPYDTLLQEINARVKVGYEVKDSSCGNILGVELTCFQIIPDKNCNARFRYEMQRCGTDSTVARCPGNTYRFYNLSDDLIDSLIWNFGDSTFSNEENPTHSFPRSGIYNICLTIFTSDLCNSTTCQQLIIPDTTTRCNAEIEYIMDSIPYIINPSDSLGMIIFPGYAVQFRDISKQTVIQRNWDFGDGTTSFEKVTTHYYRLPGIYNVCLTINTTEGCFDRQCINVVVADPGRCFADFSYREIDTRLVNTVFPQGYTYEFVDISVPDVVRRIWFINGDSISERESIYYTFHSPGLYTVGLIIYTSDDCTSRKFRTIQVGPEGCQVDFTYNVLYPDCATNLMAYEFSPFTNSQVVKYKWLFCDSTSSEEQYPAHNYYYAGTYTICLTVQFADSCRASICKSLDVPEISKYIFESKCGNTGVDQPVMPIIADNPVYPNPADNKIFLQLNSNKERSVSMYIVDILGQVRKQIGNMELNTGENKIEIDIQELPTGNYFYFIASPETRLHGNISVLK